MNRTRETILKFIAFGFLQTAIALAGHEAGGGDSYALEFTALGEKVIAYLEVNESPVLIDLERIDKQIKTTRIVSVDNLLLNGKEVDAINYPQENRIEISRSRWQSYSTNLSGKLALVFHEYLSVAGIDDSQYAVSKQFTPQFKKLSLIIAKFDHSSEPKLIAKVLESQCLLKTGECSTYQTNDYNGKHVFGYMFSSIRRLNMAYLFSNGTVTKLTSEEQDTFSGPADPDKGAWPKNALLANSLCDAHRERLAKLYLKCP